MSCFRIPKSIYDDIEMECANFWWGMENGHNNMHWKSWANLAKPKHLGGMGCKQLAPFNQALLAKQIWRMVRHPSSLLARVLKAR